MSPQQLSSSSTSQLPYYAPNMLSSSPLKPATYYFNNDGSPSSNPLLNTNGSSYQEEKFKSLELNFNNQNNSPSQFILPSDDDQLIVPISQNDHLYPKQGQFLQYPPKFDSNNAYNVQQHQQQLQSQQGQVHYQHYLTQPQNHEDSQQQLQHNQHLQQQHQQQYVNRHPQQFSTQNDHQVTISLSQPQQSQNGLSQAQNHNNQHPQPPQSNLYPAMEFVPNISNSNFPQSNLKESTSTNTITSFDSVPFLGMSSSVSDTSIASPISYQNSTAVTPRRPINRRSSNTQTTPLPLIYQTPNQTIQEQSQKIFTSPLTTKNGMTPTVAPRRAKSHRRTRSRLSLDASGSASIVTTNPSTSMASIKSPATGTNPFYTPPTFLSPHHGSPIGTPLATPSVRKEMSFSSISPTMLMTNNMINFTNDPNNSGNSSNNNHQHHQDSIYLAAADLTLKMASKYSNETNEPNFLSDPLNSFTSSESLSISETNETEEHIPYTIPEDVSTIATPRTARTSISSSHSTITTPFPILIKDQNSTRSSSISRSQSVINLASIAAPPEIHRYDILQPRKRIQKSQSATNIETLTGKGKKPKKMHQCPLCNAAFQRPEHVKRHMRSHSSEKPFECDESGCGKRFNRPDNLKAHLRKIHHRPI